METFASAAHDIMLQLTSASEPASLIAECIRTDTYHSSNALEGTEALRDRDTGDGIDKCCHGVKTQGTQVGPGEPTAINNSSMASKRSEDLELEKLAVWEKKVCF
ncbi:hypothetical protein WISP_82868 [Willisornis vidua]|uniref:Uncharacterized protein n=1 Tax=Willisornis vidua TaxID=1566151 RepID=A0ABQ9D9W9_9PASS|nr:hypothetical protein WISP_82868 [Willisornis vidua]